MATMLNISVSDLQTIINMNRKQLVEECLSKQIPIKTVNTKNQTVAVSWYGVSQLMCLLLNF